RRVGDAAGTDALGVLRDEIITSMGADGRILDALAPAGTFAVQQLWLDAALGRGHSTLLVSVREPAGSEAGEPAGAVAEFLVSLTPPARSADILVVPVVRRLVRQVLAQLGAAPDSYSGQRALEALSNYPR